MARLVGRRAAYEARRGPLCGFRRARAARPAEKTEAHPPATLPVQRAPPGGQELAGSCAALAAKDIAIGRKASGCPSCRYRPFPAAARTASGIPPKRVSAPVAVIRRPTARPIAPAPSAGTIGPSCPLPWTPGAPSVGALGAERGLARRLCPAAGLRERCRGALCDGARQGATHAVRACPPNTCRRGRARRPVRHR